MILVTGANGVVGRPLIDRLSDEKRDFVTVSRSENQGGVCWDMEDAPSESARQLMKSCTILIHCAPIWLLGPHLQWLAESGVTRIVAFSSTSVISKRNAANPIEQRLVNLLLQGEQTLMECSRSNDVTYTILRPSMIYGYAADENVSRIARFIKRYRFMLLVGKAQGKRQPVHADDLVTAALSVLNNQACQNSTYNLAGAEVITYRAMVERIFEGLGRAQRIIHLPLWLYRLLLRAGAYVSRFEYTPEMANRMSQDLVYSYKTAVDDFGYHPQSFLTRAERDLP